MNCDSRVKNILHELSVILVKCLNRHLPPLSRRDLSGVYRRLYCEPSLAGASWHCSTTKQCSRGPKKNATFLSFSRVCPEPVLVKG